MPTPPDRIAYVELCGFDRDTFRAAVLVVTADAEPVEFRFTDTARPSRVQKLLWGGRLTAHLVTHVLVKPALDALSVPPSLVVVRRRELLDLRPLVACPVVQLVTTAIDDGCRQLTDAPHPFPPAADGTPAATPEPVYLRAWKDDPSDLAKALSALSMVAAAVNPGEPFDRVRAAVTAIHEEARAARG